MKKKTTIWFYFIIHILQVCFPCLQKNLSMFRLLSQSVFTVTLLFTNIHTQFSIAKMIKA